MLKTVNVRPVKERDPVNPFFEVARERLVTESGLETDLDALINEDTGEVMSVVSPKYSVTTHKEAFDIVESLLESSGISYEKAASKVLSKGAQYFQPFLFPSMKFNPARGIESTAKDSSLHTDDYIPFITAKNSYDKSSLIQWDYGMLRVVCTNGNAVLQGSEKIALRHNQPIQDPGRIQQNLLVGLEGAIARMVDLYNKLNSEDGSVYAKYILKSSAFSERIQSGLIELMDTDLRLDADMVDLGRGKIGYEIRDVTTSVSAYQVYNAMTEFATHYIGMESQKQRTLKKIANLFHKSPELVGMEAEAA